MLAPLLAARSTVAVRRARRSTGTRSRPRSSSPPTFVVLLLVDLFTERARQVARRRRSPASASSAALIPVLTLAVDGADRADVRRRLRGRRLRARAQGAVPRRRLRRGAAVDQLHRRGRLLGGRVLPLLVSSVLGMVVMASARDLITIFVALELLSIPAYMLAGWRKRDLIGNEAGLKYYLMGVFASAVMLYGMSLIYGVTGTTMLADIGAQLDGSFGESRRWSRSASCSCWSASASRSRPCRSTTGRPTPTRARRRPITAFLSVASKAAGFVALLQLVFVGLLRPRRRLRPADVGARRRVR